MRARFTALLSLTASVPLHWGCLTYPTSPSSTGSRWTTPFGRRADHCCCCHRKLLKRRWRFRFLRRSMYLTLAQSIVASIATWRACPKKRVEDQAMLKLTESPATRTKDFRFLPLLSALRTLSFHSFDSIYNMHIHKQTQSSARIQKRGPRTHKHVHIRTCTHTHARISTNTQIVAPWATIIIARMLGGRMGHSLLHRPFLLFP